MPKTAATARRLAARPATHVPENKHPLQTPAMAVAAHARAERLATSWVRAEPPFHGNATAPHSRHLGAKAARRLSHAAVTMQSSVKERVRGERRAAAPGAAPRACCFAHDAAARFWACRAASRRRRCARRGPVPGARSAYHHHSLFRSRRARCTAVEGAVTRVRGVRGDARGFSLREESPPWRVASFFERPPRDRCTTGAETRHVTPWGSNGAMGVARRA